MSLLEKIVGDLKHKKRLALLIDSDNYSEEQLSKTIQVANESGVDYIFVGGSLVTSQHSFEASIQKIKSLTDIPVIIFPGSILQISKYADAMLLLSLISGRNADHLIGNHVIAAKALKESGLEVIPTGYILVNSGATTSVEYMSNTRPIPAEKVDIVVSTAMAGEMMGNQILYLEAGSGADQKIQSRVISEVRSQINIPLIVGGGIRSKSDLQKVYEAGADIAVVGNAVEKSPELLKELLN